MSAKYTKMSISGLRDLLDQLEETLWDIECEEPDNYEQRRRMNDMINNICCLIREKECAA